ncbi:Intraflagellar transport protein [Salix suchowensis]|nr:Intraflagellar transport protein [Salix suchowensis]
MGSEEGSTHWIVFEGVRIVASSNPETLTEIDTAITKLEYGRATALLDSPSPTPTHTALQYLNVSLSKYLPDKTSAEVNPQSRISPTSHQLHLTLSFMICFTPLASF